MHVTGWLIDKPRLLPRPGRVTGGECIWLVGREEAGLSHQVNVDWLQVVMVVAVDGWAAAGLCWVAASPLVSKHYTQPSWCHCLRALNSFFLGQYKADSHSLNISVQYKGLWILALHYNILRWCGVCSGVSSWREWKWMTSRIIEIITATLKSSMHYIFNYELLHSVRQMGKLGTLMYIIYSLPSS